MPQNGSLAQEASTLPPQDETGAGLAQRPRQCDKADLSRLHLTEKENGTREDTQHCPACINRNTKFKAKEGCECVSTRWERGGVLEEQKESTWRRRKHWGSVQSSMPIPRAVLCDTTHRQLALGQVPWEGFSTHELL